MADTLAVSLAAKIRGDGTGARGCKHGRREGRTGREKKGKEGRREGGKEGWGSGVGGK